MFTRCPQCKTVHPLNAALLSHARGLVQCGQCERVFSALSFLFDHWPSGQAHAPIQGVDAGVPVLGFVADRGTDDTRDASESDGTGEFEKRPERFGWKLATMLMVILTLANFAWTFRQPVLEKLGLIEQMHQADSLKISPNGLLKDPQQVHLVSRDIHIHPTRSGILVLSLTFVNLAQISQVFPDLELTLLDASSQPVARRRLQPRHYLRRGVDTSTGMAPDVYLPVLLELGDPGERAVGFKIRFL